MFLKSGLEASAAEDWLNLIVFLKMKWEEVKGNITEHIVNTHESNYCYLTDKVC